MSNLFIEGADEAKVYDRLPFLTKGEYVLEVLGLKAFKAVKGKTVAAEWKVIEAKGEGANEVGTSAVYLINLTKPGAITSVMKIVGALLNKPAKAVKDPELNAIVQLPDDNKPSIAVGQKIGVTATEVPTKDGKGKWLSITCRHIPGQAALKK